MASSHRFRIGVATVFTAALAAAASVAAIHARWDLVVLLVPTALFAAVMTWRRYSRHQSLPVTAAALTAPSGEGAISPASE